MMECYVNVQYLAHHNALVTEPESQATAEDELSTKFITEKVLKT